MLLLQSIKRIIVEAYKREKKIYDRAYSERFPDAPQVLQNKLEEIRKTKSTEYWQKKFRDSKK